MYNMQYIFSFFYSFQELFIESLAKEAYRYTAQGKRRTLQKKDIDSAIESADCLAFLEGVLDTWNTLLGFVHCEVKGTNLTFKTEESRLVEYYTSLAGK